MGDLYEVEGLSEALDMCLNVLMEKGIGRLQMMGKRYKQEQQLHISEPSSHRSSLHPADTTAASAGGLATVCASQSSAPRRSSISAGELSLFSFVAVPSEEEVAAPPLMEVDLTAAMEYPSLPSTTMQGLQRLVTALHSREQPAVATTLGTFLGQTFSLRHSGTVIGTGGSSVVFSGQLQVCPDHDTCASGDVTLAAKSYPVAIKDMLLPFHHRNGFQKFIRIVRVRVHRHPNILQVFSVHVGYPNGHGMWDANDETLLQADWPPHRRLIARVAMAMNLCPHGSVADTLKQEECLPEATIASILRSVLTALEFLHAQHFIHNDVKPHNILQFPRGTVADGDEATTSPRAPYHYRLSDLLSGDFEEPIDVLRTLLLDTPRDEALKRLEERDLSGTPGYMSPESCLGLTTSPTNDVWSLGITAYHLATGRMPWSPMELQYADIIVNGFRNKFSEGHLFRGSGEAATTSSLGASSYANYGPFLDELEHGQLSVPLRDFIRQCLQENPFDRPTCATLLQHPFLV